MYDEAGSSPLSGAAGAAISGGKPSTITARSLPMVGAYLLLGMLMLLPLAWAPVPPLVDYPNHLARMAILAHVGNPAISQNYVADWHLLPNLAMDLIVPPLAHLMPLELAGRLFIGAAMSLLVVGTVLLRRALHGTAGVWPLCAFLFVYNAVLWFGFLNYLFALGIALIGFAGWIASKNRHPIVRMLIFAFVASVIFVLHLFALGVFGLLVVSFELGELLRTRNYGAIVPRCGLLSAVFLPAGLMWLMSIGHGGPTYVSYGSLNDRVVAFMAPLSFSYKPTVFDLSLFIGVVLAVAFGLFTRAVSVISAMRIPMYALIVAALLMPEWVQGSWAASFRLPIVLPFLFLASVRSEKIRPRTMAVTVCAVTTLLCVRVWAVSETWTYLAQQFAEFRTALQTVPAGVRMFTVHGPMPASAKRAGNVPRFFETLDWVTYSHLSALAIIDRGAFIPSLFTGWYPVDPSARNRALSRIMTSVAASDLSKLAAARPGEGGTALPRNVLGEPPCCLDWPRTYQFVIWIDFGRATGLPKELKPWSSGTFFHIYRVVPRSP